MCEEVFSFRSDSWSIFSDSVFISEVFSSSENREKRFCDTKTFLFCWDFGFGVEGELFGRFSEVGVVQPSLRSVFESLFGEPFGTLCMRDLGITSGGTTGLDLYCDIVGIFDNYREAIRRSAGPAVHGRRR